MIDGFTADMAALDAEIAMPGESVMPVRVRAEQARHYLPESFISAGVLQSLTNIELPGSRGESENGDWVTLSDENLGMLDADRLIAVIDDETAWQTLEAKPLWQTVPAVEAGNVCVTDNLDAWILTGPTAASVVEDDVRSCLAGS